MQLNQRWNHKEMKPLSVYSTRTTHIVMAVSLFVIEVALAMLPRFIILADYPLLPFVRSYIGDYLVVILLFHALKSFYPFPTKSLAWAVFGIGCFVEILQWFHVADLLGLKSGSVFRILLGTNFSWGDIAAYALGSFTVYAYVSRAIEKH